jgi:RNA polymerase sigma factor (sigma-70 family)
MEKIIQQNRSKIRSLIKRITGSYNEDLEQEVYLKTWENLPSYKEKGKFSAWISALTVNLCRDYFRSKSYQTTLKQDSLEDEEIPSFQVSQEEELSLKQRQKIILKAVNNLPKKMRTVVVLYEFEEMSYTQIAEKEKISEGTVKSRLFSARQILAQQLSFLKGEEK